MIKRNLLLGVDIFLFLVILQSFVIIFSDTLYDADFRSLYTAAKIFLNDKDNLYNLHLQSEQQSTLFKQLTDVNRFAFLPFIYAPLTLIPVIPLTAFDFKTAHLIAFFALAIFLGVDIYLLLKMFSPKIPKYRMALISLSFAPVIVTLGNIQYSIILLTIFILVYKFIIQHKYFMAGFISSLLLIKIPLGLVLFICIMLFGKNKMRMGFIFGSILIVLINIVLLDFNISPFLKINYWYATHVEVLSTLTLTMVSYQGFLSNLNNFIPFIPINKTAALLSSVTFVYFLIVLNKLDKKMRFSPHAFALMIITTLLASPHMHYHNAVLLLFPLFWIYSKFNNLKIHLLVTIGWITMFFGTFSSYNPYLFFFHPALFLLLGYWLLIRRLNTSRMTS